MAVKFGWKAGTEQYPPQELLEYAVAAEEASFDSIDVSDHFHPWSEQGQACLFGRGSALLPFVHARSCLGRE